MAKPWDNKSVSLEARKSLRDNYGIVEETLQILNKLTGGNPWTVDADYAEIEKVFPSHSSKSNFGTAVFNRFRSIGHAVQDSNLLPPLYLAAFKERVHAHKLLFVVQPTPQPTNKVFTRVQDGVLHILVRPENVGNAESSLSHRGGDCAGSDLRESLESEDPNQISLVGQMSLNLQDNKDEYNRAMDRLKKATGVARTFDAEFLAWDRALEVKDRHNLSNIYHYFESISFAVENLCPDAMYKEAFLESVHAHKIVIKNNPNPVHATGKDTFEITDGVLILIPRTPTTSGYNRSDEYKAQILKML